MLSSTVEAYERKLKEAARKEGLEQGRHAALLETARKMLARGMPADEVVAVTELPQAEVERLAAEAPSDEAGRDDRSQ
jgi:predicted transposase/invertase (TIGR01784 family)